MQAEEWMYQKRGIWSEVLNSKTSVLLMAVLRIWFCRPPCITCFLLRGAEEGNGGDHQYRNAASKGCVEEENRPTAAAPVKCAQLAGGWLL